MSISTLSLLEIFLFLQHLCIFSCEILCFIGLCWSGQVHKTIQAEMCCKKWPDWHDEGYCSFWGLGITLTTLLCTLLLHCDMGCISEWALYMWAYVCIYLADNCVLYGFIRKQLMYCMRVVLFQQMPFMD